MNYKNILVEKKGKVAVVILNRPESLNILNSETIADLAGAMQQLEKDRLVRSIVLTGAGKAFAAGADIKEMSQMTRKQAASFARSGQQLFNFLESMPQVILAAINGFALGGGCELACACDLRAMAASAKIGEPEVNLGIIPGFAGSIRLPRLIGLSYSMRMILTGEALTATEAQRVGLVHWVFDSHELKPRTLEIAAQLAEKPPLALAAAKKVLRQGWDESFSQAQKREVAAFTDCFKTEDQKEGMRAFLEKRRAVFKGK